MAQQLSRSKREAKENIIISQFPQAKREAIRAKRLLELELSDESNLLFKSVKNPLASLEILG